MEISRLVKNQWDRVAAVAIGVLGLILLGLGWAGVSRVTLATQQIPYLASGGLFGVFCLGAAATLWLSADLRDEWRKLDDIHAAIEAQTEQARAQAETLTAGTNGSGRPSARRAGRAAPVGE
jgi:hypothetical protein